MRGRQVCWSDPKLQALAKQFVPATDEVWRLANRKDPDCLFFQGFSEEGHYGGRTKPTDTRQGIYCCTPSGRFLASVNTTDPRRMAKMLEDALEAWKSVPEAERRLAYDPATRSGGIRRSEQRFPEAGLALRVFSRDVGRDDLPDDWRGAAWNVDSLWYRKGEARSMLPDTLEAGASTAWPKAIAERLVRYNLVDNVRGQTNGYAASQVQLADIRTTVVSVKDGVAAVRFEGRTRATTTGTWPEDGRFASVAGHGPFSRGVQTTIFGEGRFDVQSGRFVEFALAAAGTRWGRTRYNARSDDLDESPIAFAVRLDPEDPGQKVAPAAVWDYGW